MNIVDLKIPCTFIRETTGIRVVGHEIYCLLLLILLLFSLILSNLVLILLINGIFGMII